MTWGISGEAFSVGKKENGRLPLGNLPMSAAKQTVFLLFRKTLFFFYYGTLCVPYVPRKMH